MQREPLPRTGGAISGKLVVASMNPRFGRLWRAPSKKARQSSITVKSSSALAEIERAIDEGKELRGEKGRGGVEEGLTGNQLKREETPARLNGPTRITSVPIVMCSKSTTVEETPNGAGE
jgi:hypothetical protein